MKKFMIKLITMYQKNISSHRGRTCRFDPTCSQYTIEVINKYGVIFGSIKAIKRILICNPLGPSGYDPS